MPRILFLIPSLRRGGEEKQLYLLARELHARGDVVQICTLWNSGPYAALLAQVGVPVACLGQTRRFDWRMLTALRDHIHAFAPDIIHTIRSIENNLVRLATGFVSSAPLITTLDAPATDRAPSWRIKRNARWVVRCPSLADAAVQHGIEASRITVIPPCVLATPTAAVDAAPMHNTLGLPANARVLLCAGQLVESNGFRDTIWATDILKYIFDDLHLIIAGTGPERDNLLRFAQGLRVADRVHWVGEQADLNPFFALADVVWVPRLVDGIPNVLLEAMAAGSAVVANDCAGVRTVIAQGENGYLTPAGDKPALGKFTRALLEDADLRSRLGLAARAAVVERFSLPTMIDAHAALYQEVLTKG